MDTLKFEQIFMSRNIISRLTIQMAEIQSAITKQQELVAMFIRYKGDSILGEYVDRQIAESTSLIKDLTSQAEAVQESIDRQNRFIDIIMESGDVKSSIPDEESDGSVTSDAGPDNT